MSYPMEKYAKMMEEPVKNTRKLLSSSVDAIGDACHEAGHEMASKVRSGKRMYELVQCRVGRKVEAANVALHKNPYPSVLIGIGSGLIVGYVISHLLQSSVGKIKSDEVQRDE